MLPLAAAVPMAFAAICGSGMASAQSLYSFFHGPAKALDLDPVSVGALVSLGSAAGRTLSPVAAVTLMCATLTGTNPFTLAKRVALGGARRADGLIPASSWAYDAASTPRIAFDRDAATAALLGAGVASVIGAVLPMVPGLDAPGPVHVVVVLGLAVVAAPVGTWWSRRRELAADRWAARWVADPEAAAAEVYRRLVADGVDLQPVGLRRWWATHPPVGVRLAVLGATATTTASRRTRRCRRCCDACGGCSPACGASRWQPPISAMGASPRRRRSQRPGRRR